MHADVVAGRRTELDFLNGYLLKIAADKGVNMPWHRAIHDVIREIEKGALMPSPGNVGILKRKAAI